MTTLFERCGQLHLRIKEYVTLRRTDQDAEAFRTRASELQIAYSLLPEVIGKIAVLRESGVSIPRSLPNPTQALKALRELRQKLNSNPELFHKGREFGTLRRALEKLAPDAMAIVREALKQVVRDLPSVDEVFLKQVEQIPAYAERVRQIRQKRDELLQGKDVGSLTSHELQEFLKQRDALKALASSIDPAEFPKSILEFFKSARVSSGAPLEKFTDEVRDWLNKRGLLKHVRVVVSDR